MRAIYFILYTGLLLIAGSLVFAQQQDPRDPDLETQIITIYTDYTIVLQDASRIQFLPEIKDTIKVDPKFTYSINPQAYISKFNPTPINAASLRDEPRPELDKGFIKLGAGNYLTPYIELFYNSTYQQDYTVGAYAKHHSVNGRAENAAEQKVFTGFNYNEALLYGSRFFPYSTLTGNLGFTSNEIFYYAYDPELPIIDKPRDKGEMDNQRWMNFSPRIRLHSNNTNSHRLNYDMKINYNYLFNLTDDYHHGLTIAADFFKATEKSHFGVDARFIYHNDFFGSIKNEDKYLLLNPYFKSFTDKWQIKLGVNTTGEFPEQDSVIYHFYPNIMIQHNVGNTIIPFVSFKGYLEDNCMHNMHRINPYIQSLPEIEVTNYAQVLDLGIKGNISRNINFQLSGNYSKIDNMPLFVNDTSELLQNKFILEYSNIERFSGYGEITLRDLYNFNFILKGNYYYYHYIKSAEKPWHLPELEISFATEYQYTRDIKIGSEIFFVGKRFAKEFDENLEVVAKELKPIIDFNLYGEYTVASNFSCFLYLNNLLGQKQYVWNNYHSLGFNFLIGLKYSF